MSDAPMPSSFDGDIDFYQESWPAKLKRRFMEEPLIPLGMGLTCWALFGATRSIRAGDRTRTNAMFRRRIYAQGFTIAAMVAGSMYWEGDRAKRREYEKLRKEREWKEKNERWMKELEAREREDREERERKGRGRRFVSQKLEDRQDAAGTVAVGKEMEDKGGEGKDVPVKAVEGNGTGAKRRETEVTEAKNAGGKVVEGKDAGEKAASEKETGGKAVEVEDAGGREG